MWDEIVWAIFSISFVMFLVGFGIFIMLRVISKKLQQIIEKLK